MENLDCYVDVNCDFNESEQEQENDQVSLNDFIDDDSETDNNPSDYYGLTNIRRSISDAENDAFFGSYIEEFLDENVEARNYCLTYEDEEQTEDFSQIGQKIDGFRKTLLIPEGKDSENSLFYAFYYAVQTDRKQ